MGPALGLLALAIAVEVAATASLSRTESFRNLGWTVAVLSGYCLSIWLLTLVVRDLPVSTAYAVWAGVGTALVAVIGIVWLGNSWDWITVVSLTMIVGGVVALNLNGAH